MNTTRHSSVTATMWRDERLIEALNRHHDFNMPNESDELTGLRVEIEHLYLLLESHDFE